MNNTERWLCLALTLFPLLPGLKRCAFLSHSQTGGLLKVRQQFLSQHNKGQNGCLQLTSKAETCVFFFPQEKDNLLILKQNQLSACALFLCEQLLLSCIGAQTCFLKYFFFQKSGVHSTKQKVIFFHLKHGKLASQMQLHNF